MLLFLERPLRRRSESASEEDPDISLLFLGFAGVLGLEGAFFVGLDEGLTASFETLGCAGFEELFDFLAAGWPSPLSSVDLRFCESNQ